MKIRVVFLGFLQHRGVSGTDSSILLVVSFPTDESSRLQDTMIKVFLSQECTVKKIVLPKRDFFFSVKYLFIWLLQVLVVACRIFCWGMWPLSSCGTQAIECAGSVVVVHGLS